MQCGILDWILEQKCISKTTGEILTNSVVNSTVNKTNFSFDHCYIVERRSWVMGIQEFSQDFCVFCDSKINSKS